MYTITTHMNNLIRCMNQYQTELLALNIYSTYNINKNWHGVAQAKAVIFFILVAVLAIAQQTATRRKEVQQ